MKSESESEHHIVQKMLDCVLSINRLHRRSTCQEGTSAEGQKSPLLFFSAPQFLF